MNKQLLFFATTSDLTLLLAPVDAATPLDYVPMGPAEKNLATRFPGGVKIPNLGLATTGSAATSQEYLVVLRDRPIASRRVRQEDGSIRYFFDQLENDASITFCPAGRWRNDVLLHGRVATVWDDEVSQSLMKQFAKPLRKSFRKIQSYWVGAEAEALLDAGKRLTIAEQSPRDFDLKRAE